MSMLRDIWADLIDKRLWPVAAGLAIALVAIPALALQPAATPAPPPPAMVDAGPAPLVADPAAIAAARPGGPVAGKFKNPFEQKHVPKAAPVTTASAGAGPGTGSKTGSAPKNPTGGAAPARPKPKPADGVKRLKVRFGPTDGKRTVRLLTPGTPLPTATDPMLVFVEVGDRSTAEFLVSSDAIPQGDGRCKPSRAICAQLFTRRGDTEFFDVTRDSGSVQYQLEVLGVVG